MTVAVEHPANRRGARLGAERRFTVALIAPAVIAIFALFGYPLGYAAWLSLHRADETLGPARPYVGLRNYTRLAEDAQFHDALARTAYFSVLTVVLGVAFALGIALLLHQPFRGRTVARVLLLVPWAVPPVVNGIMWHYIYDPNWGVLNAVVRGAGLIQGNVAWLGSQNRALNALVFSELWKLLPFLTLLFLAGLQGIPENLYRAARVDGANVWSRFLHITLPGLRAPIMFALIVQTMWSLKVFDTIYVLTQGGPARGTTTINYFGYLQTFKFLNDGGGAAVAIMVMLLVLIATVVYVALFNAPWRRLRRARAL